MSVGDPHTPPRIGRGRLVILFLVVAGGFPLYRAAPFLVWNDSPSLAVYDGDDGYPFGGHTHEWTRPAGLMLRDFFTFTGPGNYRPVSSLIWLAGARGLFNPGGPAWPHLAVVGSLYGAFAVCFLLVARRFVRSERTAWFALLLLLASPPLTASSWVYIAFPQVIVPLLMCLSLLHYWRWRERGKTSGLVVVAVLMLLGPWVREVLFVTPLLLGFLEVQRYGRATWFLGLAGMSLGHAFFPTALLKAVLFPDLPLQSVFAYGGDVAMAVEFPGVRWHAASHFLPLFPPCLWVVVVLSSFVRFAPEPELPPPDTRAARIARVVQRLERYAPWGLAVLFAVLFAAGSEAAPFALSLFLPLLGVRQRNLFLSVWFLGLYLVILRVFTEHVHFLYSLLPASVLMAKALEDLWRAASATVPCRAYRRAAVAAVVLLVAADQSLNLYGTSCTMRATYEGIQAVAARLKQAVPPGSHVVSNVIHGEEVLYHSGFHFRHHTSVRSGVVRPECAVAAPGRFQALVRDAGPSEVYLLDVDFHRLPDKRSHRNKYVHEIPVPKEDLGLLHTTRQRYFYLDPFRRLVSRRYVPFLGAPDLVNDFYYGPTRNARWFRYEVNVAYRLYRVCEATGADGAEKVSARYGAADRRPPGR